MADAKVRDHPAGAFMRFIKSIASRGLHRRKKKRRTAKDIAGQSGRKRAAGEITVDVAATMALLPIHQRVLVGVVGERHPLYGEGRVRRIRRS